jgi:hypothetical protein
MCGLKNVMMAAKLPPCSLKGHRHYGALAEPVLVSEILLFISSLDWMDELILDNLVLLLS